MEDKEIRSSTAPTLQRRIQPEHNRQMDKGLHPSFLQEGWPQNSQELPGYNPNFHSFATQQHWIQNWENSKEEPKWPS